MVQDHFMTKRLPLGKLTGGLYTLDANTKYEVSTYTFANKTTSANMATPKSRLEEAKLWHVRMRHIPFSKMKYVCPHLEVSSVQKDIFYTTCPQAREIRLPFPSTSIKTKKLFEMIHVDVWGA